MAQRSSQKTVGSAARADAGHHRWLFVAACVAILGVAAAVRIVGARNDLWLDEIWSLHLAATISSPMEVFTKIHHENNHYLNTLYLYFIGPQGNGLGSRILSLVTGIGAVAVAGLIGRRRDAATAFLAMLLTGFSYVLVLYSSEARGYAEVVFFAFLCFYLLEWYLQNPSWQAALLFAVSAILGLISHLSFVSFLFAAMVWSGYRYVQRRPSIRDSIVGMLSCYAAPVIILALLYFIDIRYVTIGGGTSARLLDVYGAALAWSLGTPSVDFMMLLTCVMAVVVLDVGLRLLWGKHDDSFVFFAGAILVFPIFLVIVRGSDAIYVRHFIIGSAFLLILFSYVLVDIYHRGVLGKVTCAIVLLGYLVANGWHTASLFEYGRGPYREAIRFMSEHSKGPSVTIASDHDFRIPAVLQFEGNRPTGEKKIEYYREGSWPKQGPEWIICHKESFDQPVPATNELRDGAGNTYEFVKTYPTAPLSGLHWFIYHNRSR